MDRLMQTVRKYALIGKRNAGHPLKRLLRTWYDDDDDDDRSAFEPKKEWTQIWDSNPQAFVAGFQCAVSLFRVRPLGWRRQLSCLPEYPEIFIPLHGLTPESLSRV
jgi:hypothetical protein